MAWIKSDQSLANHPKLILLAKELGVSKVQALGHLHLLWYWTLEYAEDGEIKYLDLLADACEWSEDPKTFINSLIKYPSKIKTIFHFGEYRIQDVKRYLADRKIPVRI